MNSKENIRDSVKEYYGKIVQQTSDLKTQACVTATGISKNKAVIEALKSVHEEVASRYYGCGLVIPPKLEGMKIVDLGSGSGRDCYTLSKLVGQEGFITGVDMTDEQIAVAWKYIDYHTEKFGYSKPNVEFIQGFIEQLVEAGLKKDHYDIIVSNCVLNLAPDKRPVLNEAYDVLKVGGEIYFSDVYADRDLPSDTRKNKVLWGECIAGALWWKDLYRLAKEIGFSTPRLVSATPVPVDRDDFKKILGDAKFVSVTYRLFKLPSVMKPATKVIYEGAVTGYESELKFDHQTIFKDGDIVSVSSELATILQCSRFQNEFEFQPASNDTASSEVFPSSEVDPFEYLKQLEAQGQMPASACCGGDKKCC